MSENLPEKYKESFFSKFIQKLKCLFFSKKYENKMVESNNEVIDKVSERNGTSNNFMDSLKVDNYDTSMKNPNMEYEKKQFMKKLKNNPELLNNFSTGRLEKILQLYREDNERKSLYLKKLNS